MIIEFFNMNGEKLSIHDGESWPCIPNKRDYIQIKDTSSLGSFRDYEVETVIWINPLRVHIFLTE